MNNKKDYLSIMIKHVTLEMARVTKKIISHIILLIISR